MFLGMKYVHVLFSMQSPNDAIAAASIAGQTFVAGKMPGMQSQYLYPSTKMLFISKEWLFVVGLRLSRTSNLQICSYSC